MPVKCWKCCTCGKIYTDIKKAQVCELSHMDLENDKIKYYINNILVGENVCDYCKHSYYVYGCEQECDIKDCYFDKDYPKFEPVDPLHNKRKSGGI